MRGERELLVAQVLDFARKQLRYELLAHPLEARGAPDHALDASSICLRIANAQRRWKPWIASLEGPEEHGEAASRQIASRKNRGPRPGFGAVAELPGQLVHGAFRQLPVSRDLAAEDR